MLAQAQLQTIIWTSDIDKAERFYTHTLGLPFIKLSHGALVYCVNGTDLRVSPVPHTRPSEHTVLGFAVADIQTVIRQLNSQGVECERFTDFPHDENGSRWQSLVGCRIRAERRGSTLVLLKS
jgi:catechol 2,3-dioxygenase-like lactoylglutathione lyase family enzyme